MTLVMQNMGRVLEEILIMEITMKLKSGWKENMTTVLLPFVKATNITMLQNVYEEKELMMKMLQKNRIQCLYLWEFSF